jgi:hypothetical protein
MRDSVIVFAIATFAYCYHTTGGSVGVSTVDGQYVSLVKPGPYRAITEYEYRMFPNLSTRVMSAWIGMMPFLSLTRFLPIDDTRMKDA